MINLVLSGVDGLIRVESFRNVTGDGHAKVMRFLSDRLQFFELHRAVNLHLLEARVVIFVGPHARLFGRVHASDAKSQRP